MIFVTGKIVVVVVVAVVVVVVILRLGGDIDLMSVLWRRSILGSCWRIPVPGNFIARRVASS